MDSGREREEKHEVSVVVDGEDDEKEEAIHHLTRLFYYFLFIPMRISMCVRACICVGVCEACKTQCGGMLDDQLTRSH